MFKAVLVLVQTSDEGDGPGGDEAAGDLREGAGEVVRHKYALRINFGCATITNYNQYIYQPSGFINLFICLFVYLSVYLIHVWIKMLGLFFKHFNLRLIL